MKASIATIKLIGLRDWLRFTLRLPPEMHQWCERVIYCHHNARVLAEMESRMGYLLWHATGGRMSKAYYDKTTMKGEVDDHIQRSIDGELEPLRKALREIAAIEHSSRAARIAREALGKSE